MSKQCRDYRLVTRLRPSYGSILQYTRYETVVLSTKYSKYCLFAAEHDFDTLPALEAESLGQLDATVKDMLKVRDELITTQEKTKQMKTDLKDKVTNITNQLEERKNDQVSVGNSMCNQDTG